MLIGGTFYNDADFVYRMHRRAVRRALTRAKHYSIAVDGETIEQQERRMDCMSFWTDTACLHLDSWPRRARSLL
jgi:hypothetical protein